MIVKSSPIDELASRIDISLCDACGALRMSDRDDLDEGQLENFRRNDATAVLISTVRRDIGELARVVREGFATIDDRARKIEERIRLLELKDAIDTGKIDGVKMTMVVIATLASLLGGLVGWVVSFFSKKP